MLKKIVVGYAVIAFCASLFAQNDAAQDLLNKGKAAQDAGLMIEALSYYIQAKNLDPSLSEASDMIDIVSTGIANNDAGTDARNAIAWRKAWVARLTECDRFVTTYVRDTPLPATLVYSTEMRQGDIDWNKETVSVSVDLCLVPDENWALPISGVVNAVYAGLAATGQAETWKLNWPRGTAAGGASQSLPHVSVKYNMVLELINDAGVVLGRQTADFSAGWNVELIAGKVDAVQTQTSKTITFPAVDANKTSERMTVRVAGLNGRIIKGNEPGGNLTVSAVTTGKFYKIGDRGPAGGIIFFDKLNNDGGWRYLECAPAATEWSDKEWGPRRKVSGTGTSEGTGKQNTQIIVRYMNEIGERDTAAQLCDALVYGGCDDWFLPSKDELNLIYTNLTAKFLGDMNASKIYWSSSEDDAVRAWCQRFNNGSPHGDVDDNDGDGKDFRYTVRAIRQF